MALVSSIYRMAPAAAAWTQDEATRRLRTRVRRIVVVHGKAEVERRVRAWRARDEIERARLARILLEVDVVRAGAGHAAGSI